MPSTFNYRRIRYPYCFTKTIVNFRVDTELNEYYVFDGKSGIVGFSNGWENIHPISNTQMEQPKPTETIFLLLVFLLVLVYQQ